MSEKVCQECGAHFCGAPDAHYCENCAKLKKIGTVVRIRICQDCGNTFLGGPRAKRCSDCAHKAQKEASSRHKKSGTKRPLGSVDKCVICGAEYTVVSGRQKYCSDACQRVGVLSWQREHKKGYWKESGQDRKREGRRKAQQKVCVYCQRPFTYNRLSDFCSDACRTEHRKLMQCVRDIARGRHRNLEKYEKKREEYRKEVGNDG